MSEQLVPEALLRQSTKVLFVTHLAIGDFTYAHNCFRAFVHKYPHLDVHLWIDEVRRTRLFWRWKYLKDYCLFDWVRGSGLFRKIYDRTYSPTLLAHSRQEARAERYPIVISLVSSSKTAYYARLTRFIAPFGFTAGIVRRLRPYHFIAASAHRLLDRQILLDPQADYKDRHAADVYAAWFDKLFGVQLPANERAPVVDVDAQWGGRAEVTLTRWGIDRGQRTLVFVNPFAKHKKRCWPLPKVLELMEDVCAAGMLKSPVFILNAPPEHRSRTIQSLSRRIPCPIKVFTAANYFELPALIGRCHFVISVDTCVMHLAAALGIPVIALMRQRNPEWQPWNRSQTKVVLGPTERSWVKQISVATVLRAVRALANGVSANGDHSPRANVGYGA